SFPIGAAYSPGGVCSGDNCTVSEYPEHFVYSASDRIWDVFGIARPQEIGPQPIQENYIGRAAQYAIDYAAWEQRHDAALPQYQQLNNAIAAFNRDFSHRQVDHFTIYDGTQQVTRTVVTQSDPGTITSGGSMTLNAGVVNNVASQIVAGGDLTGNNVIGTRPNNVGMQCTQTVTTTGQAIYTHVDDRDRVNDAQPWQGQTQQTQFQLDVSATSGTGPHSQPTVKSVAATATAGQGNGSATAVADHMTIAGGAASIAVPTGGTVHAVTSTVAAPAGSTVSAGTAAVTVPNSSAVIRTVTPNLTLPNNALYRIVRDPGSSVLVETDPRFTSFRQWSSSDAMLSQFRNDPGATLKRIGDGFYEQQLIQQQIIRATGQRFISDYTNNEDEYKALLAAGVAAGKAFGLNVGTALTDEQMARLTTDIVWMVKQTVTLADGSQQEVLVPQVYLRAKDTDITGGGTLMAGNNVSFQAKGDVTNSGTIASRRVTVVTGDNIVNTGTLAGKTLLAQAAQDINNLGGHIQGDQVLLSAGRDVNLTSTSTSTANATTLGTNISQVASVDAGTLGIQAGRDVNLTAAAITTSGSAGVAANRDVNLSAVRQSSEEHVVWGDKNRSDRSAYADVGTQIQTGGNLAIGAGQDVSATAAYANATGSIQVAAGRDVNLNAGQSHQDVRDEHFQTEKGFLSSKTTHTIDSVGQTNAVGTTLSGDKVTVAAGRDLNVRGSNVAATQDVSLQAKNDVNIESTTSSTSETHYRKETQSGLMGSGGIGFTIGNRLQSEDDRTTHTLAAASTVGSTGGNVSITAGNQYRQVGSNVIATQGDVDILAKKVDIQEAREQGRSSRESKFEQSGLTVAVTAPVIAAMQTASQMGSAASETSDTRLKMLAGGATALAGKNAADAIAADPKSGGGASISITVGGSKSESKQTQDADTAAGSTVRAGGDVRIRATGDGQNSTLTVQGSDVQAGKNALLKADGDINLLAAKNTADMERSSSSMSGGVGVAVSVSSNGASFGVTANASASRGTGNGHDVTWTNTHVNARNQLTLESGGDTNLKGAVASGRQVVADVGGNLNATSLQDTSTFHSKDQSISGSVTVGYGFSGSASVSQQKIDSDYASVTEQSGIKAGDGGFQINVRGNTGLKGAVITSTDKAVQNGANSLTTATLTTSDIQNHADYNASSIGIGGGYSSGGSGVGKNQKGEATTGGDKVPGSTLPSAGGFSATPPVVMGASGSGSSTTVSGVSGGAIHITNGAKQQALTGKDADQTVAGLNRNVSSEVDTTGALKPIFNEKEIRTGFEITGTFISQAGTFLNNRAQESTAAQKALDAEKAKPADQQDAAKIAQLTQTLQDNATWGMGGTGRMLLTALTAGAGANVTGGMGQLAQNATVAYLQALGANQVKQIADGLGSEDARAALHAIVGCAGAAAGSQSCGAGAMGAATSSVIGSLLSPTDGMTPDQRQARENLVTSLVASIAGATGVNAATATSAGQIEVENNQVWGPAPRPSPPPPSPGQPRKPFETPGFKGETAKKGDGVISDPVQQLDPTVNVHANPINEQTGPKILVSPIDIVKSAIEHIIATVNGNAPEVDAGKQGKHQPGHNNFIQGRSELTYPDPQSLVDEHAGKGQPANNVPVGQAGSRERVDFGKIIGKYVDPVTGESIPTTKGIIHYGKDGVHIVPSRP
ncbi:hemagglutinin repeat-containing protein, partial [Ralstonia nicotianae]